VRFSPAVALDGTDGLFLDITGVSHLWDGEAAMLDDLLARLAGNGIRAQGVVADTPGAAWALARYGDGPAVIPPGSQASVLAPLPVAALRLDAAATAQLPRLGLTRITRLLGLPRAQLTRRFGPLVVRRLDQALGQAEEALIFRRPPNPWFDRLAFAEPISQLDDQGGGWGPKDAAPGGWSGPSTGSTARRSPPASVCRPWAATPAPSPGCSPRSWRSSIRASASTP